MPFTKQCTCRYVHELLIILFCELHRGPFQLQVGDNEKLWLGEDFTLQAAHEAEQLRLQQLQIEQEVRVVFLFRVKGDRHFLPSVSVGGTHLMYVSILVENMI